MKYYQLLLFLFFANILFAQNTEIPLWFTDSEFEKNVNRWYKVLETNDLVYYNALYVNPDKDFRLVAEFDSKEFDSKEALLPNNRWGLSWGRRNAYYYNHFEINDQQEFRIGYQKGLKFHALETWQAKPNIIKKDFNTLEIRHLKGTLSFLINDKVVYKMPFAKFEQSTVAMRTTNENVIFKRFSIYQDMGEINLAKGIFDDQLTPENLGEKVNSAYVDKAPSISPDGKVLYFIREFAEDGYGLQDIYTSSYEEGKGWSKAQNIGEPLNNNGNNFICAVLPDNNTLMAINSYTRKSYEDILSFTYRTADGWSKPESKLITNLGKIGNWVSFDLAADGKAIVYSAQRDKNTGGRDLYVSFLLPDGNFSSPKNLGTTINTTGNEHCPFLAADGKTLYFDTDGHPGYGGRDIFMSKRLDDSWTNWSTPLNLGSQINTKGADEGLVLPASGEYAYFVSDKNSLGGLDIFRLKMPQHLRPEPTAILEGFVLDCYDNKGVLTTIRVYEEGNGKEFAHARTNPKNGAYKLALVGGAKYWIVADFNSENIANTSDTIRVDLSDLESYVEQKLKIICLNTRPPSEQKTPIRAYKPNFKSVYFDFDKYVLTPKAKRQLDQMADSLKAYPSIQLQVLGHTDSNGSNDYNWTLAVKRSAAVVSYLESKGIERKRFDFKGFGETKPADKNTTSLGRAHNRRVAFEIID